MRALCFGFHYTPLALDEAVAAMRGGGIDSVSWLLHPNRLDEYGPQMRRLGVDVYTGTVADGLPRAGTPPPTPAAEHDLQFLVDREGNYRHAWERSLALEVIRRHVHDVLEHVRPDVVLFGEVPHAACSYLLYRLARLRGIPVVTLRWGPTPLHVNAVGDIDQRLVDAVGGGPSGPISEASDRYVATLRGDYEQARPAYSRDSSSLEAKVRSRLKQGRLSVDPRLVAATVERARLRKDYEQRSVPVDQLTGDLISVFLHIQPERTTCPEGGRYVQQFLEIAELSEAAPPGWKVVVREHPSTFVRGSRLVQTSSFYDEVLALGNTVLASTESSSFALVDRSRCVATVSGTIAFEAAVRGTPALVFGNAVYRGCRGVVDAGAHRGCAVDFSTLDSSATQGDPVEEFLARFDHAPMTWVAEWTPSIDVRQLRNTGAPFAELLPRAIEHYTAG
jgi:hypothetical protein